MAWPPSRCGACARSSPRRDGGADCPIPRGARRPSPRPWAAGPLPPSDPSHESLTGNRARSFSPRRSRAARNHCRRPSRRVRPARRSTGRPAPWADRRSGCRPQWARAARSPSPDPPHRDRWACSSTRRPPTPPDRRPRRRSPREETCNRPPSSSARRRTPPGRTSSLAHRSVARRRPGPRRAGGRPLRCRSRRRRCREHSHPVAPRASPPTTEGSDVSSSPHVRGYARR
jgi:hypothetical protein